MDNPIVIIITGHPATGKTTLGHYLATELNLPFFHKDGVKELLFDHLGWSDRAWSRKLGIATYAILEYIIEVQVRARQSFIVESNFNAQIATTFFLKHKAHYPFTPIQVLCKADGPTLHERFYQRATTAERHPGHVELQSRSEFTPPLLQGRCDPLDIGGHLFELDTTDFAQVDYTKVSEQIRLVM